MYTFLDDETFVTLTPTRRYDEWSLLRQTLNYTTTPPAHPPSASEPELLAKIRLDGAPKQAIWASVAQQLIIVLEKGLMMIQMDAAGLAEPSVEALTLLTEALANLCVRDSAKCRHWRR